MLRIRLARTGKKKQAHYRVVVANIESKRDGRIVERIGHYTPLSDPITYQIDESRALYWLSVGAQPSDAVRHLLKKQGTLKRLERVRSGEPIENLVAEFEGQAPVAEPPQAEVAEVAEAEEEEVAAEAVAEAEAVAAEATTEEE